MLDHPGVISRGTRTKNILIEQSASTYVVEIIGSLVYLDVKIASEEQFDYFVGTQSTVGIDLYGAVTLRAISFYLLLLAGSTTPH